jgi:hypothetical protein
MKSRRQGLPVMSWFMLTLNNLQYLLFGKHYKVIKKCLYHKPVLRFLGGLSYFLYSRSIVCDDVVNYEVPLASGEIVNAN